MRGLEEDVKSVVVTKPRSLFDNAKIFIALHTSEDYINSTYEICMSDMIMLQDLRLDELPDMLRGVVLDKTPARGHRASQLVLPLLNAVLNEASLPHDNNVILLGPNFAAVSDPEHGQGTLFAPHDGRVLAMGPAIDAFLDETPDHPLALTLIGIFSGKISIEDAAKNLSEEFPRATIIASDFRL